MTVRNPQRSRQSFYRITDPYLRFWFRFVLPAQGRLTDADGARRHLEGHVLPRLNEFVASPAFEEVCQEWLRGELDAVAVDEEGVPIAVASCKWTDGEMPAAERTKLEALARYLRPDDPPALYLFSRSGFERSLRAAASADPRLNLVGAGEL